MKHEEIFSDIIIAATNRTRAIVTKQCGNFQSSRLI